MTSALTACAADLRAGDILSVFGVEARVHHTKAEGDGRFVYAYAANGDGTVLYLKEDEQVPVVQFAPATDAEFQGL